MCSFGLPISLAGHLYCAIGALSFLDRLPPSARLKRGSTMESTMMPPRVTGITFLEGTLRWLASRQLVETGETVNATEQFASLSITAPYLGHDRSEMQRAQAADPPAQPEVHLTSSRPFQSRISHLDTRGHNLSHISEAADTGTIPLLPVSSTAGFNGRCNKTTDTCYSFWICGSLSVGCQPCHLTLRSFISSLLTTLSNPDTWPNSSYQ